MFDSDRKVSPLRSDHLESKHPICILVLLLRKCRCLVKRLQHWCAIVTVLLLCSLRPSLIQAETYFIPSLTVSERYDTNIWFAPAEFLPPGTRLDDFATTVAGGVQALYRERDIEASLTVGGDFNAYVYNPGLNFFTTRLEGYAKLDSWIERLVKGSHLRVADRFRYTPESPGFISGVKGSVVDDPFLRGIQQFRANTWSNTASINATVPVFRALAADAGYSFSSYRVGSILAAGATGATFFDTTVHNASAGPRYVLSRQDSLSLSFERSQVHQTPSGGSGQQFDFTTQSALLGFERVMQDWTARISGGITHISGADKAYPVASIRFLTSPERVTAVRLELSRQASPSFFFVNGALISNVGQLAVSRKLSRLLSLEASVNYGLNETVPDASVKFTSFTAGAGLKYKLTKVMILDFYYNYNDFKTEQVGSAFEVIRNVVGFSLTAEWK
jgi:opacity protein-like surface antigen